MIVNNLLQHIFNTPSSIPILRTLNTRSIGLSGREIARLSKLSNRTAQSVLANLESLGIVTRTIGGRDHLFSLKRSNRIVTKLISYMFEFEIEFQNEIVASIKKKLAASTSSLVLFGSVARREEVYTSDFDLCIIYNNKKSAIENLVSELRDNLYDNYNISLAPFYITEGEFRKRAKNNLSPVDRIIEEGILISGKSFRALLQ